MPRSLVGGAVMVLWSLGPGGCAEPADLCPGARDEAVRRWRAHVVALEHDAGSGSDRLEAAHRVLAAVEVSPTAGWRAAQHYAADDAPASFRDVYAATRGAALACAR